MSTIKFFTFALLLFSISTMFISCGDDDDEQEFFQDLDEDGFGNPDVSMIATSQPEGFVENSEDINDNNAEITPESVWGGPNISFTKDDGADWTLAENQDRITDNVWITRANNQGIFNISIEEGYTDLSSPSDTEWAIGTTANVLSGSFVNWEESSGSSPRDLIGQNVVLHLISDNIFIDLSFTSWASGGSGGQGGFSYDRSTPD
jgi:hypothetical protein